MSEIVELPYAELPSYKPLFLDYLHRFSALAPFFPGDPFEESTWRRVAAELEGRSHPRTEVAAALRGVNERLGADESALASIASLENGALVVVTGQQVGLLGGPLYTLYKALTAVRLARWASSRLERPVVPLFWMDADDHDFAEVQSAYVIGKDRELVALRLDAEDADQRFPVGERRLSTTVDDVMAAATEALPPSEFSEEVLHTLRECYAPGRTLAEAFGSWLLRLTRGSGLAIVDPGRPELKRLAAGLFEREVLEGPGSSERVRKTTESLVELGYHAQASPSEGQLNLFYAHPERYPIALDNGRLQLSPGASPLTPKEVARRVGEEPERFSPNVLLRPLYQDTLFPTLSYVAGPNELAYFAQLPDVYRHFGITMPVVASRSSLTVIERPQARFLERYHVELAKLSANDESLLNDILREHTPPQLDEDLSRARSCIQEITAALEKDLARVDPTLVPTVSSTRGKLLHHLKDLESKALRAVKRKNDTVRNQFFSTRTALYPGFSMQERKLSPVGFVSKHGWHFSKLIEEAASPQSKAHLLFYI